MTKIWFQCLFFEENWLLVHHSIRCRWSLITCSLAFVITEIKTALHKWFSMTNMGLLNFFPGLEINQSGSRITISQPKYVRDLLAWFQMSDCKPKTTPFLPGIKLENGKDTPLVDWTLYLQLVGILLDLTHSHPNLSYAVGAVYRYMQEPHELH